MNPASLRPPKSAAAITSLTEDHNYVALSPESPDKFSGGISETAYAQAVAKTEAKLEEIGHLQQRNRAKMARIKSVSAELREAGRE